MLVEKTWLLRHSSINGDDGTMRFKQHLQSDMCKVCGDMWYVCWQRYMHRYRHAHKHRHMYIGLETLQHAYGQCGNMQHVYSTIQSISVIRAVPKLLSCPAVSSVNLCKRKASQLDGDLCFEFLSDKLHLLESEADPVWRWGWNMHTKTIWADKWW